MKVLHLTAGNLYGGVERVLTTLARCRHLCPGMEPAFGVCFPGRQRDELLAAGVPVFDLGAVRLSRPWTVLLARRRLRRLLTAERFDAVVTHQCWPHAVFAPAVSGRLIHFAHGPIGGRHWLERLAARTRPAKVLANSRFTAGLAERLFPQVPTAVVGLPVPAPPEADRAAVRAALGAGGAAVVLHAARLSPWKGQAVLLDALAELADVSDWQAWFAGGPQSPAEAEFLSGLERQAKRRGIAGRVRFLGQRADVPGLMAAADVYCQPNTAPEPFGVSLVEALSAGRPVVTAAVGGGAEVVTPDCGRLVPPGDAAATAAALRELLADAELRTRLGSAGPARARELCDPAGRLAAWAAELSA